MLRRHGYVLLLTLLPLVARVATLAARPLQEAVPTAPPSATTATPAPSQQELHELIERLIATTHRSDAAQDEYAFTAHFVIYGRDANARPKLDRVYRVYPTGVGPRAVRMADRDKPVTPEKYRRELADLEAGLLESRDPAHSDKFVQSSARKKEIEERYRAVEGFRDAYQVTWLGTESLANYPEAGPLAKLLMDPKPGRVYGPVLTEILICSRLTLWVQPGSGALVQLDAEMMRDLRYGVILVQVARGSRLHIEQTQVMPGIWLPSSVREEHQARSMGLHFHVAASLDNRDYRHVGSLHDLFDLVDLAKGKATLQVPDP